MVIFHCYVSSPEGNISTNSNLSIWNIRNVWGLATPTFQHIEKRKVKFKGNPPTLHITKCLSDFIHNMSQAWHENMRERERERESAPTCVSTSERKETLIGPRPGRLCQNVPWIASIAWIALWRCLSKCVIMFWLVVLTIWKNMKVNGKDDIPYIMEKRRCLKPPTSHVSSTVAWRHTVPSMPFFRIASKAQCIPPFSCSPFARKSNSSRVGPAQHVALIPGMWRMGWGCNRNPFWIAIETAIKWTPHSWSESLISTRPEILLVSKFKIHSAKVLRSKERLW